MAESLGDALLTLRTDDAQFNSGVAQAEGRARVLGSTLDKASGSSAKLATDMVATGRSAAQMGAGFEAAGRQVTASAGAQRQGLQQLGFQLNDVATMYSLGARPSQIFASQIGQVTQAVQLMTGGTSRLAAFLGGPWGIALTAGTIVLAPFIGRLLEAEDALDTVSYASDNLGDAQSRLRDVIDTTTGSIDRQKRELVELYRVQALGEGLRARRAEQALRGELAGSAQESRIVRDPLTGLPIIRPAGAGGIMRSLTPSAQVVRGVLDRSIKPEDAKRRLGSLRERGAISEEDELRLSSAIANLGIENVNRRRAEAELRFYDGRATAADKRLLGVNDLTDGPSDRRGSSPGPRSSVGPRAPRGPDTAEIDARGESDLVAITQQILRARLQFATSSEERAEIARQGIEWDRREAQAAIASREGLSDALRADLAAATDRLADAELEAVAFNERIELARQTQALADERARGEAEALQNALALADTDAERKAIALRLLAADEQLERLRLQAIITAQETDEAERARAQIALDNLEANAPGRRAAVGRQNETEVERYLRDLNQTPGQINEAIDGIRIDGLEALNDGLVDAITGAESLGDVFSRIADQIIADLLRIAIQQAIIRPLANSLFGGIGGDAGGGLLGGLFAGFFATGGTIPAGQFGIVGERGPELAFAGPGGLGIMSNSDSRAALGAARGTTVPINISIDATGADAAAIARLNARLDQLREELPGQIVSTVQEASDRRVINLGGGR